MSEVPSLSPADVEAAGTTQKASNDFKLSSRKMTVVTPFDAGFAGEPGMRSQLGFMSFVADCDVEVTEATCSVIEYGSSVIHRVVRSTLAAEAASLSTALDRHLYARLVFESLIYGEPTCGPDWRHKLKIPGLLVTDARSLYDHLGKTGSVPKEKQTLIDLLVARDLLEEKAVGLKWVPTDHMLADVFTKAMPPTPILLKFLQEQKYCVTRSMEEQERDAYRLKLRQGQRQRRKQRK